MTVIEELSEAIRVLNDHKTFFEIINPVIANEHNGYIKNWFCEFRDSIENELKEWCKLHLTSSEYVLKNHYVKRIDNGLEIRIDDKNNVSLLILTVYFPSEFNHNILIKTEL